MQAADATQQRDDNGFPAPSPRAALRCRRVAALQVGAAQKPLPAPVMTTQRTPLLRSSMKSKASISPSSMSERDGVHHPG